MSGALYAGLSWLPPAPQDFAKQCRSANDRPSDLGLRLRALATHALDESQLNQLARAVQRARAAELSLDPLVPFKLGILSNATTHFLVPALVASALRHGIALDCVEAEYDQVMQTALSPDSAINRAQADAVLLAIDYRGLPLQTTPGDAAAAQQTVMSALAQLESIRRGIRAHGAAACIVQTLAAPAEHLFGSLDAAIPGTLRQLIDAINTGIASSVRDTSDLLLDVAAMAQTVGLANWHDPTLWNLGKLPFAGAMLPLYAEHVCRLLAAQRGKSRRCLILDLDNTVWGGVIGDDGLEGIVIAQGDATGEAHLEVQRTALKLRARGIVLAVSSKNDDAIARLPFRQHPEMLLREQHLAVFQANWNDKARNIEAIASELNLGLDAMVFLDDNPAERTLVRQKLPQVAVPELPDDPALYARSLLAAGYFEAIALSAEDLKRADFYQDNARRIALQQQTGDLDSYLASLQMVMTLQAFDEVGRSRIAQLINKSNQYNLTTRRYTEAEVEAVERDPEAFALQVRLADCFGDNGMISVVICRRLGEDWVVDSWLMSCRVLGRRVEHAVLQELIREGRTRGIRRIFGDYLPSGRNQLVIDHYEKLGFRLLEQQADGRSRWVLELETAPQLTLPMTVRRPESSPA